MTDIKIKIGENDNGRYFYKFFSTMMARHVTVKVIIPFDIADLLGYKQPFPTLYFLPGYSANAESIVSSTILAERAAAKGFAVVIPDGENSFYVDQPDINTFYERFVVEELVSVTRKLLPISDKQEDTYIGGISMGGYGCMMLASRHPETFSKVLALSPATKAFGPKMLENGFTQALLEHYLRVKRIICRTMIHSLISDKPKQMERNCRTSICAVGNRIRLYMRWT